MRTATRCISFIVFLTIATILSLLLFNLWQLGACRVVPTTCGTLADRVIPGWRHGVHSHHVRKWVTGMGWEVEYSVSHEEKLEMLRRLDKQPVRARHEL